MATQRAAARTATTAALTLAETTADVNKLINKINPLTHCIGLAQEMLHVLENGTEMISEGNWPEMFHGNSSVHVLGRETVCNVLNLTYNDNLKASSMQVARAILCQCIARAESQPLMTLDNMRHASILINIPQIARMQMGLNNLSQRIDRFEVNIDQKFNELIDAVQVLKNDINRNQLAKDSR